MITSPTGRIVRDQLLASCRTQAEAGPLTVFSLQPGGQRAIIGGHLQIEDLARDISAAVLEDAPIKVRNRGSQPLGVNGNFVAPGWFTEAPRGAEVQVFVPPPAAADLPDLLSAVARRTQDPAMRERVQLVRDLARAMLAPKPEPVPTGQSDLDLGQLVRDVRAEVQAPTIGGRTAAELSAEAESFTHKAGTFGFTADSFTIIGPDGHRLGGFPLWQQANDPAPRPDHLAPRRQDWHPDGAVVERARAPDEARVQIAADDLISYLDLIRPDWRTSSDGVLPLARQLAKALGRENAPG